MAELVIKTPTIIRIENKSNLVKTFQAYRENFFTRLAPLDKNGEGVNAIEFEVKTSGQVFYYLNQATTGLEVSTVESFTEDDKTIKLNVPAKITITNNSDRKISFLPYKENFQFDVLAKDKVELVATNVGQVLYYLAQATDGLEIKQEAADGE